MTTLRTRRLLPWGLLPWGLLPWGFLPWAATLIVVGGARGQEDWDKASLARDWQAIVEDMDEQRRAALTTLPVADRAQVMQQLLAERRRHADAAFVDSLGDERRAAYEATPAAERSAKLLELRIDRKLTDMVRDARELGIETIDEADISSIRSNTEKAALILELQKQMFLHVHRDAMERFPKQLNREIASLPPRQFFRHGAVQNMRARAYFSSSGLPKLRNAGTDRIEAFVAAAAAGTLTTDQLALLSDDARARVSTMNAPDRRKFSARIRRLFFREAPRSRPRRGSDRRLRLSPEQFRQLAPAERELFVNLGPEARRNFVRRRFPGAATESSPRLKLTVAEFLDGLAKLPEADRQRLLDLPMHRAVQKVIEELRRRRNR